MKIVFISGVKFGYDVLKHILENKWKVSLIFSYNDVEKKMYSDSVSFDELANQYGIQNVKVNNINDPENISLIKDLNPDLILVMGWSQLLKTDIIGIPSIGIIGSHPTELPKYRGRAPIPWTIIKELKESAETFFWISEGTDNGAILDQQKFSIIDEDDAESIYNKVSELAKGMIIKNLELIQGGIIKKLEQDVNKFIEYWPKRSPEDGKIEWSQPGRIILRLIRASTKPYPGGFTFFKTSKLIIWKAEYIDEKSTGAGMIMQVNGNEIKIGTGQGVIKPIRVSFNDEKIVEPKVIFSKDDVGVILNS